ncbi:uncharacterized protein LOC141713803 [Apium graveolens]|uniref:uncharacterized protein LOC141713803 n=1 Tax=Apium graveolens TaxID=4045 RepID=UPI003D7B2DF1
MDFVEQMPESEGMNDVLVVIDRLSKYGHFIAIKHPFTAADIADIFLDNIFKLHGMPASIVSDRDKVFTSIFWTTMFQKLGVELHFSSAYHPRLTPYEALYGVKPVPLNFGSLHDMIIHAAQDLLQQRVQKIGNVAYKLKLPDHSKIHPAFHVSLLKKHVGTAPITVGNLPEYNQDDLIALEPMLELQRRQIIRNSRNVVQWLIHWKGMESFEAFWEDASFIQQQFPQFQA